MDSRGAATPGAPIAAPPTRPGRPAGRALLFLLVCAPIWLVPGALGAATPAVPLCVVLGVTLLFLRWDRRPASALGLDPRPRRVVELLGGFGGGVVLVGAIALVVRVLLPFPWAANPGFRADAAAWSLLWLLGGNAVEELLFRGYALDRLAAGVGVWPAQLAIALLFALFHVVNGWSWPVALIGTTSGSLLFGLVFLRWRSVPAAVGVHAAANWTRDLLLTDPPRPVTLFAPLSPRPWTQAEQLAAAAVFTGVVLLTSAALARSLARRRAAPTLAQGGEIGTAG